MVKFFLFLVVLWLLGRLLMRVLRGAFVSFLQGSSEGRGPLGGRKSPDGVEEVDFEVLDSRLADKDEERPKSV
ncbi:hypothetical protein FP507_10195 [Chlorobium phaeovibrioides]|uniref:Uncharacterized protein n=1 Tax=Chlorobium phaeovibrioides TaxID=1094 RepID=A0A5M8I545_CHLPH|nr:hypothetical protein [Chlorobium phaeovibrioides]KAA6230616.1 hypothetical protein FP507_10195 [Chlorobium phaeovibrioides]MDT9546370.1 hypothetical protein [Chlorobium phaeovibrioides]